MGTDTIKLPKGFVLDPPEGFEVDIKPPEGFVLDKKKVYEAPTEWLRTKEVPEVLGELKEQEPRPRWDEFIDATARGTARVGSAAYQAGAFMEEMQPMTAPGMRPQEPSDLPEIFRRVAVRKKLREKSDFLWKLSQNPGLASQNKDLASKALNLIGETIPYITATTAGYVTLGPMGGFTVGSMVEGNSAYRTAVDHYTAENKGESLTVKQKRTARKIGVGVGVVSGAVEAFGGKYAEQLLLKATTKLKTKIAKAGAVFGIGTIVEALEEGAQEIAAITGEETYRDVNWNESVTRTLGAMAGGGFLGGVMRGGSMAGRRIVSPEQKTELKSALKENGVSPKVAERAAEMLEEGWTPAEIDRNLITPSKFLGDKAIEQLAAKEKPKTVEDIRQEKDITELDQQAESHLRSIMAETPATVGIPAPQQAIQPRTADKGAEIPPEAIKDKTGKPLVFYHGTTWAFDKFDKKTTGLSQDEPGEWGTGFYFTPSPKHAEDYTNIGNWGEVDYRKGVAGPNIRAAYLAIKNPFIVQHIKNPKDPEGWHIIDEATIKRVKAAGIKTGPNAGTITDPSGGGIGIHERGVDFRNKLIKAGYDGVIVKSEGLSPEKQGIAEIVAFYPEQVINAIGEQAPAALERGKADSKITAKRGTKLTMGLDPGLDKYIAENVKPALITAAKALKTVGKIVGVIPKYSAARFLQPSLEVERKSPAAYVAVMKAVHTARDAARLDFKNMPIEALDMNIEQARKYFNKFTKEQQYDFVVAFAGQPGTPDAALLQQEAFERLPTELTDSKVISAIREIADKNHEYLKKVVGPQVHYVPDYFYGVFESKLDVDKFWAHWTSTDKFTKKKLIPSVADAIMHSLESGRPIKLRQDNYIDNLMAEYLGIARLDAMKQLKKELLALGAAGTKKPVKGTKKEQQQLRQKSDTEDDVNTIHPENADFFITEDPEMVQPGWRSVADPVFRAAYLRPDLARLINNMTSTNKITRDKVLNPIRQANAFTRSLTFFLSAFHLKTVTLAAISDSGWGGPLIHPKRAAKPFRQLPTAKRWAKIQQTPEYKRLLKLGVGLGYSAEEEAYSTMSKFMGYIDRKNMLGATGKLLELPLRIPLAFQKWQFDTYIPMLKHIANIDEWAALEKRTGRPAEDADLIDIIKATQNFYGEMNERLLGRSATQTTGSRFVAKAPGFAEGNVRTNIDAGTKFTGQRGVLRGRRARAQIVNSLLVKRVIAIAGTLWLAGKWPKRPEKKENFADLFKIDTGKVDGRGRRIMINTLDSDKDYLDLWFNMFVIRPDRAMYKAFNRLGGMKSTLAEFVYDGFTSMMRQDIRNWKGDKVFSLSDTPLEKLWKYTAIALERLEPISVSVFKQMRYKEISEVQSFLGALAGVRTTWSEQDKRESEFLRLIYEQKGDLEVLDIEILSKKNPQAAYEHYNKVVKRILSSKYLPKGFKKKYGPELYRDVDKYLQNKAYAASQLSSTEEGQRRQERAVKILKHFKISQNAAEQLLTDYYNRPKVKKAPVSPLERDRILGRARKKKRLKERMQ